MAAEDYCNDPRCDRNRRGERHAVHDISSIHERRFDSIQRIIDAGSDMTGTAIGTIAGAVLGGPPGAVVGGIAGTAISHVLKNVGNDVSQRILSPREEVRVGAALIFGVHKVQENLNRGHKFRDDDFFDDKLTERAAYKEIVEGVLLAAQREYEEKKTRYYGNLLANIAFSPGVSRGHASLLIKLSQSLSYRQLCLLSIFGQGDRFTLRQNDYRNTQEFFPEHISLLQEIFDLVTKGLIMKMPGVVVMGHTEIVPARMKPEGEGETLFKLMGLKEIEQSDLENIVQMLK
jgi:hypothetical protein